MKWMKNSILESELPMHAAMQLMSYLRLFCKCSEISHSAPHGGVSGVVAVNSRRVS